MSNILEKQPDGDQCSIGRAGEAVQSLKKGASSFALGLMLLIVSFGLAACADDNNAIENQGLKPEVIERFKAAPNDASGDPNNGGKIFARLPCTSCHAIGGEGATVGPDLGKVGANAASRVPGVSASQYIYHIVVMPQDANLPNYRNTTMPSFATSVTPQELRDLTAYLLQLK